MEDNGTGRKNLSRDRKLRNVTSTGDGHPVSRRRSIDENRRHSGDILSLATLAVRQPCEATSGFLVAKHPSVESATYGKLRLRIYAARTLHCRGIMYVLIYIAAVAVANLMVAHFGPAATPIIAFFLIGLDLAIRDRLHLDWRGRALWSRMLALIAAAGVVSYALNPAAKEIALASLVAFGSAAMASAIVFQLARRFPILARANGANVAGAAVDSIVFPLIAFGAVFPTIAALQFVAKVAGGALWSWVVFRNTRTVQAGIASNVVDR